MLRNLMRNWICLLLLLTTSTGCTTGCRPKAPYKAPTMAFDGPSIDLEHTAILDSLDEPIPPDKNAIWCATFQLAWDKLKADILREDIQLDPAAEIAARLNASAFDEQNLEPGTFYAEAGFVKDGILQKIQDEMQAGFGRAPHIESDADTAFVAYAYLQAQLKFATPFFDSSGPLMFKDSKGNTTAVSAFGVGFENRSNEELLQQVEVLFTSDDGKQFILDPYKTSSPNQLIIARVNPKATLGETIQYVQEEMESFPDDEHYRTLGKLDQLLIPNINFNVEHAFSTLENAHLLNKGFEEYFIQAARQDIRFRLDRSGADLKSESANSWVKSEIREFLVNGPFLVYLKNREAEQPFFAMWIDNAELLSVQNTSTTGKLK